MSNSIGTMRRLGVAAAVLTLALTACSSSASSGASHQQKALMTPDQAVQKLTTLLNDAMSDVKPPLQYWESWPRSDEQTSGLDDHSLGYATASRDRNIMTKVAKAKYGALLGILERSWKAKGYTITSTNPNQPAMFAKTPDGSSVSITFGDAGNISIGASVSPIPVIRDHDPFGTPTPEPTRANGNLDLIPKYDDAFWSN